MNPASSDKHQESTTIDARRSTPIPWGIGGSDVYVTNEMLDDMRWSIDIDKILAWLNKPKQAVALNPPA